MNRLKSNPPQTPGRRLGGLLALGVLLAASGLRAGQSPPPIGGVTGTIALDGTVDDVSTAANTIVVKSADGVRHMFRVSRDLLTHGKTPMPYNDWLAGLKPGATVVAHYSGSGDDRTLHEIDHVGDEGLKVSEGVVRSIDRRQQKITVRFEGDRVETLQLTPRAASGSGADLGDGTAGESIVVYYTDSNNGIKEAHHFRKKN